MAEINTIQTFFSESHWKKPFKVKSELKLADGTTRTITDRFSKKQRATFITLAIATLLPSLGLNILVLMLTLAYLKQKKIHKLESSDFPNMPNPYKTKSLLPDPGPLPLPPPSGIRVGSPNVGNTCWLNAVLKMLACDPNFDGLYDQQEFPKATFALEGMRPWKRKCLIANETKKIQEFQRTLKVVIYQLRTQSEGVIDRDLCLRLVKALPILMPNVMDILEFNQQEAAEAISLIQSRFGWPNTAGINHDNPTDETKNNFLRTLNLYEPQEDGVIKYAHAKEFDTQTISLTFTAETADKEEPIDIGNYYQNEHESSIPSFSDFDLQTLEDRVAEKQYLIKQMLVNIPQHLYVNIQRNVLTEEGVKKNCRPIELDSEGRLILIENDLQQVGIIKENHSLSISPKYACAFEVATAIVHEGDENEGHYICIEKTPEGKYYRHDDSSVTERSPEEALESCAAATYLGLRLLQNDTCRKPFIWLSALFPYSAGLKGV
jgi:hypothetical protein